jgi:hypothetical protein
MAKVKTGTPTMVWRISESSPQGEWVDLSARVRLQKRSVPLPEDQQGDWVRSSYDLLDGIDMTDDGEPVPPDVFDELFSNGNNLVGKAAR